VAAILQEPPSVGVVVVFLGPFSDDFFTSALVVASASSDVR
jgi:hypothetical protein